MANLRTNNLSGEQGQNAYRGSVQFNGAASGEFLNLASSSDFDFSTGDVTVEAWVLMSTHPSHSHIFSTSNFDLKVSSGSIRLFTSSGETDSSRTVTLGQWHHIAAVRGASINSGNWVVYLNGIGVNYSLGSVTSGDSVAEVSGRVRTDNEEFHGFISNLRVVNGTAVYTSDFTPPTSELTLIPNTVLLCCQDSDDPTQEATGKTITANGNLTNADLVRDQPKVIPPYGVDAGNVFGGSIQQSSQGYMYFPTGRTDERGRGRAVFLGGGNPSVSAISFTQIQSLGNAEDFGSLSGSKQNLRGGSSTTRGLSTHSSDSPYVNTIEFITIATTSNAEDFGDMSGTSSTGATGSNDTRAVFWLGTVPSTGNTIDFATIATAGNTSDFGDMTVGVRHIDAMNSSTRCVIPGGWTHPAGNTNTIQFITFATTGNAQDFGDVSWSGGARASGGFSSPTRGVFAGGADTPSSNAVNIIHFVTLASTGNSTDFGDLTAAKRIEGGATSSHIRGLIAGSNSPAQVNNIEFVTIASTGNSQDFGDILSSRSQQGYVGALSDCHGGLT